MSYEQRTSDLQLHNAHVYSIDGTPVAVADLAHRVHNSDYGLYMNDQNLRFWKNFGYDRETMLKDLGPDVHPIGHQNETYRHLALLLEDDHCLDSDEDLGILMLTCRIHDMGESMHHRITERLGEVVGDIPAGEKTDHQRLIEKRVRCYIYEQLLSDIHSEVINRVEAIISHEDETILHQLFEVAHELQTFDTCIRAKEAWEAGVFYHHGETMQIMPNDGGRTSGLLGIHRAVLSRSGLRLLTEYGNFSHVQNVLEPYMSELQRYREYQQRYMAA